MRSTRSLSLALASLALTVAACGGDDGGSGTIDASQSIDAPPGAIDAAVDAPMGTSDLGKACTGNGQGTCATGFVCLSLTGGSGSWCSKTCANGADMSCRTGYIGTGFPACVLGVRPPGAPDTDPGVLHCQIICEDLPGAPTICPAGTTCDRTCPTPLRCTADLKDRNTMALLARGCQ